MPADAILYPLFALIALTFGIALRMGFLRVSAARRGDVKLEYFKLNRGELPDYVAKVANNFNNLLELPLLFYVLVALVYARGEVSGLMVALAWLFVLLRFAHSYVHITHNRVMARAKVFLAGAVTLMALWAVFFVQVVL